MKKRSRWGIASDKPVTDSSTNQELVDVLKTIGNDDRAKENTGTQCS